MAKRRAVRREMFANRYRGRITFPADASSGIWSSFNTGMSANSGGAGFKWSLIGACVYPAETAGAGATISTGGAIFQLSIGTQTALLNPDDMQCISHLPVNGTLTTSGAAMDPMVWTFPILSPIPVFAQVITVGAKANASWAVLNSKVFGYELIYVPGPVSSDQVVEYLQAFGQV